MRLIDADRLLQGYEDHDFIDTHIIWNAPTVDAVPVIRCKDCKFNKNDMWVDCPIKEFFGRTLDNYCSLAERKKQ